MQKKRGERAWNKGARQRVIAGQGELVGFARATQVVGACRQAATGIAGELHGLFLTIADLTGWRAAKLDGCHFKIRVTQSAGIVGGGTAIFTGKHVTPPGEHRGG